MTTSTPARLRRTTHALWTFYAVLGGVGLIALLVVVVLDVALRYTRGAGITGSNDLVASWFMTTIAFAGIALSQRTNGGIQVDFVMDAAPGRLRKAVDVLVLLSVAAAGALFAWFGWLEALEQMEAGEYAPIGDRPLWPFRFLVPIGFAGFALACLLQAIDTARSDPDRAPESEVDRELAAIADDGPTTATSPEMRSI